MKKKLYRSIDAPWMQDEPTSEVDVCDISILPIPANTGCVVSPHRFSPPQCSTCGFQYAYGDARLHQKCYCDVKVIKKTAFAMVAMVIIGLAAVAAVIWWRMPHL